MNQGELTVSPTKNDQVVVEHQVHVEERPSRGLLALGLRLGPDAIGCAECPHIVEGLVVVLAAVEDELSAEHDGSEFG